MLRILASVCLMLATMCPRTAEQQAKIVPSDARLAAQTVPPVIFFVDVESGPVRGGPSDLGIPISIFGKGFGASRGNSRVLIGDSEVASYLVWGSGNAHNRDLDMIVVQPGHIAKGGPITVVVNQAASNAEFSFAPAAGKIYYVAPDGDDKRSCAEPSPCRTVGSAVLRTKPGDAVLVRQGNYSEGEIWIRSNQGGQPGHSTIIKNYPGEAPVFGNRARDFYIDADHVTVSGLNFRNGKALYTTGWASTNQRNNRFYNNTFTGTIAWAAIEMTGHDHVLAGNLCDIAGSTVGTMGHCYYLTQGTNLKVLYNVASGAPGYGLHIYDERRSEKDFQRIIRDVLVEGNILKNSRERSGLILDMSDAGHYGNRIENVTVRNNVFVANNHAGMLIRGAVRNVAIYNNTFYQNGRQGIYVDSDPQVADVSVRNNLFYQSENANCSIECGMASAHVQIGAGARDTLVQSNSYHPGKPIVRGASDKAAVTGKVVFYNETAEDFHLQDGSAALLRGVVIPGVQRDHDGRLRPQSGAYDIGAYQH